MRLLANDVLDERLRWLRSALNKLEGTEERPRARKTARRRVLAGLRRVREQVDALFPAIVERSAPRARKTGEERVKALKRAGWVPQGSIAAVRFAGAGVPIKHVKWKTQAIVAGERKYIPRKGWVQDQHTRVDKHEVILAPGWAVAIGADKPSELRAAKKSVTLRKAALVARALT